MGHATSSERRWHVSYITIIFGLSLSMREIVFLFISPCKLEKLHAVLSEPILKACRAANCHSALGRLAHCPVIMTCSLMGPIQIMIANKIHPTYLLGALPFTVFSYTTSAELNNWTKRNNVQSNCPCSTSKQGAVVTQLSAWCWHGFYSGLLQNTKYANKQNKHNLLEQLDPLMV